MAAGAASKLRKVIAEDLEVGSLRLKLSSALNTLYADHPTRKRELHVSDFTANDKAYCPRRLILRWIKGEEKQRAPTWVQYDGKEREEKWKKLFEIGKMMLDYQMSMRVGRLVGHPDFIVDFGRGPRIVELTGYDPKTPWPLMAQRLAVKRRQLLLYMGMYETVVGTRLPKSFVIAENKSTNQFKIYSVDHDEAKILVLMQRVDFMTEKLNELVRAPKERRKGVFDEIPRCGSSRCRVCKGDETWTSQDPTTK